MTDIDAKRRGRGWFMAWSTREILVAAAISLAFAVVLLPYTYLFIAVTAVTGPVGLGISSALWFVPSVVVLYVVRRPGAALLAQTLVSLALAPVTPFGLAYLFQILTVGLPCEIGYAVLTRYRRFGFVRMAVAGVLSALLSLLILLPFFGFYSMGVGAILLFVLPYAIGGALLGGVLSKALSDALAKTGVLSGLALEKDKTEEI